MLAECSINTRLQIYRVGENLRRHVFPQARNRNGHRYHRSSSYQGARRQEERPVQCPTTIIRGARPYYGGISPARHGIWRAMEDFPEAGSPTLHGEHGGKDPYPRPECRGCPDVARLLRPTGSTHAPSQAVQQQHHHELVFVPLSGLLPDQHCTNDVIQPTDSELPLSTHHT
jgi:hypothetical protein